MKSRHKKLALIGGALAILGIIAALILNALNSNIALYITPTEVAAGKAPKDKLFRIGGLVRKAAFRGRPTASPFHLPSPIPSKVSRCITKASFPTCSRKAKALLHRAN